DWIGRIQLQGDRVLSRYGEKGCTAARLLHRNGMPGRHSLEMGVGRTSHRQVGRVAVRAWPWLALTLPLLAGWTSNAQVAAVGAGGVAGATTGNAAVGFAVGVATDAGANYVVRYYGRTRQGAEQDAIAQVAGTLPVGGGATWKIEHTIPIGNEHGELR